MKIVRNYRKINETSCQELPRKGGEQFQAANKGLRPASSSCFQKSTKIGAKGSPGGAAGSFQAANNSQRMKIDGNHRKINENRRQKGPQKGGKSFQPANSGPSRSGGRG